MVLAYITFRKYASPEDLRESNCCLFTIKTTREKLFKKSVVLRYLWARTVCKYPGWNIDYVISFENTQKKQTSQETINKSLITRYKNQISVLQKYNNTLLFPDERAISRIEKIQQKIDVILKGVKNW